MLRSVLGIGLASLFVASVIALPGALNGQDKPAPAQPSKEKQQAPKVGQATKLQEKPMGGQAASPAQQRQGRAGGMMAGGMMGGGMGSGPGQGGMMMCPCMKMMMGGGGMMGPAMGKGMMQRGMMMGRTMMGGGGMMGGGTIPGHTNQARSAARPRSTPLTKDQAKQEAETYLKSVGNPNLKLGKVNVNMASYEVQVVTKDNSEVNWIIINKRTGQMMTLY